jgi:hypothetical protein
MTRCDDIHGLIARLADDDAEHLDTEARGRVDAHLADCASCRTALDDQRHVVSVLRSRPAARPAPAFTASLSARLDDASGLLGLLDWRAWTFGLAPVAMALAIIAFATSASSSGQAVGAPSTAATIDSWTRAVGEPSSVASAVWQEGTTADTLLETMLTGGHIAQRESSDAR